MSQNPSVTLWFRERTENPTCAAVTGTLADADKGFPFPAHVKREV